MSREFKVLLDDKLKAVKDCLDGVRSIGQVAVISQVNSSSVKEETTINSLLRSFRSPTKQFPTENNQPADEELFGDMMKG